MRRPFFAVATDVGRYSILRRLAKLGGGLFLFSRVTGPAVLSHKTREQIYLHIQAKPGAYYRSIKRDLSLAHGTLTHHLYTLERERLIRRHREGVRLRFFPITTGAIKTRALSPLQLKVLELVRAKPGITQSDIARTMAMSRQSLHYHIDQLRRESLLLVAVAGRETHLAINDEIWNRVGRCQQCGTPYSAAAGVDQRRCSVCSAALPGGPGAALGNRGPN